MRARANTNVVLPSDLVGPGVGLDSALEVDVVTLLDVGRVQAGAEEERRAGNICNAEEVTPFNI